MTSNLYWISALSYAIILILILINDSRISLDQSIGKSYRQLISWCIFFCMQDVLWGLCAAKMIRNDAVFIASSSLFHISAVVTTFFWLRYAFAYLEEHGLARKILFAVDAVVIALDTALVIANIFRPLIFEVSEGEYTMQTFRSVSFMCQYLIYILIGVITLYYLIRTENAKQRKYIAVFCFVLSPIFFGCLQLLHPNMPFYSMGYFIGIVIIHIFVTARDRESVLEDREKEHLLFDALSSSFLNVYMINAANQTIDILKLDGYVTKGLTKSKPDNYPYEASCKAYIDGRVYEEDRPMVYRCMSLENLLSELKDKHEYDFSYRVNENGKIGYYQGKYVALKDGYIVCGFQNIDEMVITEINRNRQLEEAKKEAEEANRAKTKFLFNMSHDIRTPMNAIIGYARLMEKNLEDSGKLKDYLGKIMTSSDFLLDLINNVLEMARIESGKMELDESTFSVHKFVDSLYSVFEEGMKQKNITYTKSVSVEHEYVFCDIVKLKEIYLNIISNALKYTPAGGSVSMNVTEIPSDIEGYALIRFTVSDTGIGMSEDYLPHIFEEFSREKTVTENKVQGTGLGMPIVKKLVDMMGGTINVKSRPGEGTTFTVTIHHRISGEGAFENAEAPGENLEDIAGKHILLAEDNAFNAEIATEILKECGAEVEWAEDGIVCVDKLEQAENGYYDLILMDIQMPNMDGYKATRIIRQLPDEEKANIPIIAMTANAFEEDRQDALDAGMNGHLSKPFEVPKLLKVISTLVNDRTAIVKQDREKAVLKDFDPKESQIYIEMKQSFASDVVPGGFFAYRAEQPEKLLYANELACSIWGCDSFGDLYRFAGGSFRGLIHPDDYDSIEADIWQQIKSGESGMDQVNYRILKKDGSISYIDDHGRLVRDPAKGDIFYVFVTEISKD